jgi:acyl-CoA synthetase (AMP-forming)/AMP-acid ligase II
MNPLDLVTCKQPGKKSRIVTALGEFSDDELMGRAAAISEQLSQQGLGGTRGIVSLKNGPDFFAGLVGAWLAGAAPVLLDPMLKKELLSAAEMTHARFLVSDTLFADALPGDIAVIAPEGRRAVLPDPPHTPEEEPILYLFTSGSSGKPTLVPKTYRHIEVEVDFISALFDRPERVASLVPWCHIWGLLSSFFVPLRAGGACDLTAGVSGRTVLERASAGLLDLVVAVPAYYQAMVRLLEAGVVDRPDPRCRFASSSAPLTAALRRSFTALGHTRLTDIYGSTEAGGIAFRHKDGPWTVQPHVAVRVDADGALWVRSPSVSFETADGFYRIGDIVSPTDNGFVLLGRGDDVVKIGGRRIALGEIQTALEAFPEILRAAVFSVERRGALRLAAVIEPVAAGAAPDEEAIKKYLRGRLADHKVPGIIRVVDRIPLAASGKVARQALPALLEEKG